MASAIPHFCFDRCFLFIISFIILCVESYKMKRLLYVLLFCLILTFFLEAESLSSLLPAIPEKKLETVLTGNALYVGPEEDVWEVIPSDSFAYTSVLEMEQYKKRFTIALAQLIDYPDGWNKMTEDEQYLFLLNRCLRISTMSDITYNEGKKPKKVFGECVTLHSSDSKDVIDDRTYASFSDCTEGWSRQEDTQFGECVYHSTYQSGNGEFFGLIENYGKFKMMGIPVVAEGNFKMRIEIQAADEGLYICIISSMVNKTPQIKVMGIGIDIEESIVQRVFALRDWFMSQLYS